MLHGQVKKISYLVVFDINPLALALFFWADCFVIFALRASARAVQTAKNHLQNSNAIVNGLMSNTTSSVGHLVDLGDSRGDALVEIADHQCEQKEAEWPDVV